ncbi:MAG: lipid-A-disaccharide synthase-related protein [Candidatus Margulisiibacteriota bacterium]
MPDMVLFISNGHGEDLIAATIIKELRDIQHRQQKTVDETATTASTISALPLVGKGNAYSEINIPMLVPGKEMPSGGFVMTNKDLFKDIKAGWLKLTWKQLTALWKIRKNVNLVVSIGDTYPLLLSLIIKRAQKIFLSTAKSSYVGNHNHTELWAMRGFIQKVYARDQLTSDYLSNNGINSEYAGNVMMDNLTFTDEDFGIEPNDLVIGILPGSRQEAYANLEMINKACNAIRNRPVKEKTVFLIAIAPTIDKNKVEHIMEYSEDVIVSEKFGDVLNWSEVIIGLSGTANEQAVGLGKPVVAFPASGPQTSHYRFRLQRRLLGNGVTLLDHFDPDKTADTVLSILADRHKREEVKKTGLERMGKPGAAKKIASEIHSLIK